ncbi:hypothetical protein [Lactobacillus huangpiensis]|uniref:hypothetical protein n=1 Tax=Lactobacillus huangpiensis TaxID=2799571 RepID=UPI001CC6BC53|nr:hypothetical protein [Lactobacillus huangpiensis]
MKLTKLFKKYIINKAINSRDDIKTRKYILADKIINLEKELDLTKKQTAKVLKIPLKKLFAMENIDLSIDINDYQLAVLELNQIKMDRIIDASNRSTVVK